MSFGYQYQYAGGNTEYAVSNAVKEFYKKFYITPRFIEISVDDYTKLFKDTRHEISDYEFEFSIDSQTIRARVSIRKNKHLRHGCIWTLLDGLDYEVQL